MKRLIKKSELLDAIKYKDSYYEIFINPSYKELSDTLKTNKYRLRGLLTLDGTLYAWGGNLLHEDALRLCSSLPSNSLHMLNDKDKFWVYTSSLEEAYEYIKNNKSKIEDFMQMPFNSISINFGYQSMYSIDLPEYIEIVETDKNKFNEYVANKR